MVNTRIPAACNWNKSFDVHRVNCYVRDSVQAQREEDGMYRGGCVQMDVTRISPRGSSKARWTKGGEKGSFLASCNLVHKHSCSFREKVWWNGCVFGTWTKSSCAEGMKLSLVTRYDELRAGCWLAGCFWKLEKAAVRWSGSLVILVISIGLCRVCYISSDQGMMLHRWSLNIWGLQVRSYLELTLLVEFLVNKWYILWLEDRCTQFHEFRMKEFEHLEDLEALGELEALVWLKLD